MYDLAKIIGELNFSLFKLREPLYKYLTNILIPILGEKTWEQNIFDDLKQSKIYKDIIIKNNIKTFHELDMSILLEIFIKYFDRLKYFYNKMEKEEYFKYYNHFCDKYFIIKIREYRNAIAHPNNKTINMEIAKNILENFYNFGLYIEADKLILKSIEILKTKYLRYQYNNENEKEKNNRIIFIEEKVIKPALNCEYLKEDVQNSVLTTLYRLKNLNTPDEIDGFFTGAQNSPRGKTIKEELRKNKLNAFEDISDEYKKIFVDKSI